MNAKQKILVTGGSGYIGSHTLVEILETSDWEVISSDNYSNSSADTYDRIKAITGKTIKHYDSDLCDPASARIIFSENPDITGIIHFAAFKAVPESVALPLKYYHNNLASLVNILQGMSDFRINNLIFSSSCSVYGNIAQLPVTENSPLSPPASPYAYTKVIGENMVEDFCRSVPWFRANSLRYFNPVGAHVSGQLGELPINKPTNLVPVITQTAIGKMKTFTVFGDDYQTRDGSCIRDYIHVSDIARAHVLALKKLLAGKEQSGHKIFNLGSGHGVSVLEAIRAFEKVSGMKPAYQIGKRRDGDVGAIYSDCSKAKQELGWEPVYSLEQMMETAWKWEKNLAGKN